jgi:hypothetical protein
MLSLIIFVLCHAGNGVKDFVGGLRHNLGERYQEKRRRSWQRERNIRGGADVHHAMIAGISLSISNPDTVASEFKLSKPALHSVHVDNASCVETSVAHIVLG